ncbi:MAG: DUF2179 domain-containing protein [Phycisphaera sp.]|nr:DUF2179 domain-containing protein [Phycisphaera sp.]
MWIELGGALLIFVLRIVDVSIGTLRVVETVRGNRVQAVLLGFFEAGVFISAISVVMSGPMSWVQMVGYAGGYATGTAVGMTIEKWIASGHVLLRAISRGQAAEVVEAVREAGFGVTTMHGQGKDGPQDILFMVVARRKAPQVIRLVEGVDPDAFVVVESAVRAVRGYVPHGMPAAIPPAAVRK